MKTTTPNKYCIEGRFWSTIPARVRTAEEVEALLELRDLVAQEEAEEKAAVAKWLGVEE